ncbi:MAG: A/G-specific adenine glycosylase [Phycisphaerae bacterium]|nr:A/G-specific adenine glycosylase [Phycisphaerae bacterium]MBT6269407.1 A/G-specific adenine glycosylase [Phycisphaerae bacterium]MBT6282189.1 A/G-specific adenine glycosylase [Phycisphaerae bacterium]
MAFEQEEILQITSKIESWFTKSARDFPWRNDDFPWGRLVCEFMAQQTQIDRVAQRWPIMLQRFPDAKSMAISDEQGVLELWQGLGYYRRAKNLKKTAEVLESEFGGEVPSDIESLLQLPGVGKYTAGAIASIAFEKHAPIVDANVHRVLCRLCNHAGESTPSTWTWQISESLVTSCNSPRLFNEGLMELGATVCTSRSPSCDDCPLQSCCSAYKENTQRDIPPSKKRAMKKCVYHYSVVVEHEGELAFEQRKDSGLWAGMWQVPTIDSDIKLTEAQVRKKLHLKNKLVSIGEFEHVLSHRIISFSVFSCKLARERRFFWVKQDLLHELPLASAQRKVLAVHCIA